MLSRDSDRTPGVLTPTQEAVLRLAVEHEEELLTGTVPGVLDRAATLLAATRDADESLPTGAAWRFAAAHHRRGEHHRALEYCAAGDGGAGPAEDRARLLAAHAAALWAQGSALESRSVADRALAEAEVCGDAGALAGAWTSQALVSALEGDREANLHAYQQALTHAERAGDLLAQIRVHSNLGSMLNRAGQYAEALRHLDTAVALAETQPPGLLGALANINRADALLALGRLDEAISEAGVARDLYRAADAPLLACALLSEAEAHRIRGNAVRAHLIYREAIGRNEPAGSAQVLVPALAGLAMTTVLEDPAAATSYAKEALTQPAATGHLRAMLAAGWVALATDAAGDAREWAQRSIDEAGHRADLPELADALELRALCRADAEGALADLAEAHQIWDEVGARIRLVANRLADAVLRRDRAAEATARRALQTLGVRVDAFRIAGPLQAVAQTSRPEVEIRTLGGFAVIVAGDPVPSAEWPSRKSRDLVKVLAARQGRPISRDALAELLWPGVRDTSSRLSVALSTVRSALDRDRRHPPDHFINADREKVGLDPDTVALDIAEFSRTAQDALRAANAREPDAIARLEAAASLYPAPFLAGERATEWSSDVRDELQSLATRVKRALAKLFAGAGDDDQAVSWWMALLAEEPYDESAHQELIRRLRRAGRHGEALRAHRVYTARMSELDVATQSFEDITVRHPGLEPE